jgi:hypothetical protein
MFSCSHLFSYRNFKYLTDSDINTFKKYVENKYRIKLVDKYKISRVNGLNTRLEKSQPVSQTCKNEKDESALAHIMKRYTE